MRHAIVAPHKSQISARLSKSRADCGLRDAKSAGARGIVRHGTIVIHWHIRAVARARIAAS
jgi:hypothetical protein